MVLPMIAWFYGQNNGLVKRRFASVLTHHIGSIFIIQLLYISSSIIFQLGYCSD
jgi:hypothetical protein